MPIVQINGRAILFAHVPKCAGTSVEEYLRARFGPLALLDRQHYKQPPRLRWSATSPQHIDVASLARLFPPGHFAESFAVVRHPAARLRSAFRHAQTNRLVPPRLGFMRWLASAPRRHRQNPHYLDHHMRPMNDLVPEGAKVFRMEDGLGAVIGWLDALAGNEDGPRDFGRHMTAEAHWRKGWKKTVFDLGWPAPPPLDEGACRLVHELFPEDYARFGYGWDDPLKGGRKSGTQDTDPKHAEAT